MKSLNLRGIGVLACALGVSACAKPDNREQVEERARIEGRQQADQAYEKQIKEKDTLIEKARAEGKAVAEEQMRVQIENQDKLVEQARKQGRAVAEEDLKTQLANQDKLIQKARAEGRAQAEEQLRISNQNLESKAGRMEADLSKRHLFYQAAAGTYEGDVSVDPGKFKIRVTLVPSLPPYPVDRIRQLEEITSDINNLYFNAQIVQWSEDNSLSSVGCRVSNIRPDMVNGTISIASPECANLYLLNISDKALTDASPTPLSRDLAQQISGGKVNAVAALKGEVRPTTNSAIYDLYVNRKVIKK